jgi:uncharacterized protein with HEPN domain
MNLLSDQDRIHNICVAYSRIEEHISGVTKATFYLDQTTKDAIGYCLIVLGANVSRLSDSFKNQFDEFPGYISILRNYGVYNDDELWDVLKGEDLGVMKYAKHFYTIMNLQRWPTSNEKMRSLFSSHKTGSASRSLDLDRTYKYPIKTSRSLWTVRKK